MSDTLKCPACKQIGPISWPDNPPTVAKFQCPTCKAWTDAYYLSGGVEKDGWTYQFVGHFDACTDTTGPATAPGLELENGTTTLAEECPEEGTDYREVIKQLGVEKRFVQMLDTSYGLVDPGKRWARKNRIAARLIIAAVILGTLITLANQTLQLLENLGLVSTGPPK